MKALLKTLKALADGNRLRILRLLLDRPLCVCELRAALGITQPSVSKHLRILEEAGLVEKKRQGQFIDYQVTARFDQGDEREALLSLLFSSLRRDLELTALSQSARGLDRQALCQAEGKTPKEISGVSREGLPVG